MIYLQQLS